MGLKSSEEEAKFLKSTDTTQEVSGWKVFIFLPQNTVWKFVIIFTTLLKISYIITRAMYGQSPVNYVLIDGILNSIYAMDVILAALHGFLENVRKLKHGEKRNPMYLMIDVISLIPLQFIYQNTVYGETPKSEKVGHYLSLIGVLRVYQIPRNFHSIKKDVKDVKIFLIVTVTQVVTYIVLLVQILGGIYFQIFSAKEKQKCVEDIFTCVVRNATEMYLLIFQMGKMMPRDIDSLSALNLVMFFLLIGYLLTYAYLIPMFVIVILKYLIRHYEFYTKLKHKQIHVYNGITEKKLRHNILEYYREMVMFQQGEPELMGLLPLCLKKNIFVDIHWEAMRHSYILQDLSIGCKRSLALGMQKQFLLPSAKLFEKDKNSTYFVYLESGVLQVMAEENNRAPVLSLTAGTVIGEMSFFFNKKSKAFVRASKYSIIHVLPLRHFFQVLADYPNDRKQIFQKMNARIKLAKSTCYIKNHVCTYFSFEQEQYKLIEQTQWGNIKWIKGQYRAISNLQKQLTYNPGNHERWILELGTQIKHTSVNLPLLSVNDDNLLTEGLICLKTFPWIVDPHSRFISIWRKIIVLVVSITVLVYPYYIAWFQFIPHWFFVPSCIVNFAYTIDIVVQLTTAIRINNFIVKKSSTVLVNKLNSLHFYFDVISAVPCQIFVYYTSKRPYGSNLFFLNALFKIYVLVPVINKWNYGGKSAVYFRTFVKYFFLLIVFMFYMASFFKLTFIHCAFGYCPSSTCRNLMLTDSVRAADICCALKAIFIVLQYLDVAQSPDFSMSVINSITAVIAQGFTLAMTGECIASYVLDLATNMEFRILMEYIYTYMGKHDMKGHVRERVMALMEFQFAYNKGNYIPEKPTNWDTLPYDLEEDVHLTYLLPVLSKCRLFESEDKAFLFDLCKRASILVLPANSLLLTLGNQSKCLYVIKKGFVQLNSFIAGDLHLNVSKPICMRETDAFPVLDVLSQTPSAVSAIASTDCELLCLDLEDLISTMMIHGIFKDFVDAITATDLSKLSTAKLGVTEFKDVFRDSKAHRREVFDRLMCVGVILRYFLKKRAIDSESRTYWFWELFRVVSILLSLVAWPSAIGCVSETALRVKIYIGLLVVEVVLFCLDFYIRINVAYYNRKGIYVTHTLLTAQHYLTTAFITDLVAFCPNLHILHMIIMKNYQHSWSLILANMLLRSVTLYRFIGLMVYYKERNEICKSIMGATLLALILHYYLTFKVNLAFTGVEPIMPNVNILEDRKDLENISTPHQLYFYWLCVSLILVLRLAIHDFENNEENITVMTIIAIMGVFCNIWLYSRLTIQSMMANKNLTTYQHYMRSFVNFLTKQKAEDNILKTAIDHFEYEWKKQKGYDIHTILSQLPQTLHEDILLPIYRDTLSAVRSLHQANEYFYRSLCVNIEEVHLTEGSLVIFEKEVQSYIFFIYRGQCVVEDTPQILFKGAMIGDIRRKGIMDHNIKAKTNLKLLKIPSSTFYQILENFDKTKKEYLFELQTATDYLTSVFYEPVRPVTETISPKTETTVSEFVPTPNMAAPSTKEKRKWRLNSTSRIVRCLPAVFMVAAYVSVLIVPVFMSVRLFNPGLLYVMYVLDVIWLAKIVFFCFVEDTSEVTSKIKRKSLRRLQKFCSVLYLTLSVFPIEVVPYAVCRFHLTDYCCYIMCLCYVNRLLRFFYVMQYFRTKQPRLIMNMTLNMIGILASKIAIFNSVNFINLAIHAEQTFDEKCYKSLSREQIIKILSVYFCTVNNMVNAGQEECAAKTILEFVFTLFVTIYAMFVESLFINQVLMIFLLYFHNKFNQMIQIQQVDRYLTTRDISPILRSRTNEYFCNLLNSFYEGANPIFIKSAPSFIKTDIMENLYITHLTHCFAFNRLDNAFLRQLTTRMSLSIFFPGDYITEKGDVDHNIYFIQAGEVYSIETDSYYTALERITGVYADGEVFGVLQGIFQAYPHTHTRRAKTMTRMLVLNYSKWEDLRMAFPDVTVTIYNRCMQSLGKHD